MTAVSQLSIHTSTLTTSLNTIFLEIGNAYHEHNKARHAQDDAPSMPVQPQKKTGSGEQRIKKAHAQFMDTLDQLELSLLRCREVLERADRLAQSAALSIGQDGLPEMSIKHDPEDQRMVGSLDEYTQPEPMTIIDLEGRKPSETPVASDHNAYGMTPIAQSGDTPASLSLDTRVPTAVSQESGALSAISAGNALTFLQDLGPSTAPTMSTEDPGGQSGLPPSQTEQEQEDAAVSMALEGFDVDTSMFEFFDDGAFDFGVD